MVFTYCNSCYKKIYYSIYEQDYKYTHYCFDCLYLMVQEGKRSCIQHQFKTEGCKDCQKQDNLKWNRKRLWRTDNEEDYLDSTACEYSKTEYDTMKTRLLVLKNRHQQLKIDLCKCNEEMKDLEKKIAIADKEQEIRKKLRRETRELIPSLINVQEKAKEIKKNIQGITSGKSDNESISDLSDDEDFDKLINDYINKK